MFWKLLSRSLSLPKIRSTFYHSNLPISILNPGNSQRLGNLKKYPGKGWKRRNIYIQTKHQPLGSMSVIKLVIFHFGTDKFLLFRGKCSYNFKLKLREKYVGMPGMGVHFSKFQKNTFKLHPLKHLPYPAGKGNTDI